jgi:hypothetical protein
MFDEHSATYFLDHGSHTGELDNKSLFIYTFPHFSWFASFWRHQSLQYPATLTMPQPVSLCTRASVHLLQKTNAARWNKRSAQQWTSSSAHLVQEKNVSTLSIQSGANHQKKYVVMLRQLSVRLRWRLSKSSSAVLTVIGCVQPSNRSSVHQ